MEVGIRVTNSESRNECQNTSTSGEKQQSKNETVAENLEIVNSANFTKKAEPKSKAFALLEILSDDSIVGVKKYDEPFNKPEEKPIHSKKTESIVDSIKEELGDGGLKKAHNSKTPEIIEVSNYNDKLETTHLSGDLIDRIKFAKSLNNLEEEKKAIDSKKPESIVALTKEEVGDGKHKTAQDSKTPKILEVSNYNDQLEKTDPSDNSIVDMIRFDKSLNNLEEEKKTIDSKKQESTVASIKEVVEDGKHKKAQDSKTPEIINVSVYDNQLERATDLERSKLSNKTTDAATLKPIEEWRIENIIIVEEPTLDSEKNITRNVKNVKTSKRNIRKVKHLPGSFTKLSELRKRVQHNLNKKPAKYACPLCQKEFLHVSSRYTHIKNIHQLSMDFGKIHCLESGCSYSCGFMNMLQKHLTDVHEIPMEFLEFEFDSFKEFEKWKQNYEIKEVCRFIKKSGCRKNEDEEIQYLYCNRSGNYATNSTGKKRIRRQGTAKINSYCTACIKYNILSTGKVVVNFCTTHYGHEKDYRYLQMSSYEKNFVVERLKRGLHHDIVLDTARSSFDGQLGNKLPLISTKDINNIQRSYKLKESSSELTAVPAKVPAIKEMETWVEGVDKCTNQNPVMYYKKVSCKDENNTELLIEDECVVLMTMGQREIYSILGENGVAYVTIIQLPHYTNLYLVSLLLVDEFNGTFPVAFMICNRYDEMVMRLYFREILTKRGSIKLRAMATDNRKYIYDAWCSIMGPVDVHFWSNRYVDEEWRDYLSVVEDEVTQSCLYDRLYTFIESTDDKYKTDLEKVIEEIYECKETSVFGEYLKKNFLKEANMWASCYLKEIINIVEPINFDHTYNKIKDICENSNRKYSKCVNTTCKTIQPNKTIQPIFKLILELQIERNNKLTAVTTDINNTHNMSQKYGVEPVFPLDTPEDLFLHRMWKVTLPPTSENTNPSEIVWSKNCPFDSNCILQCSKCSVCCHSLVCSCSSYKNSCVCVHIHQVGTLLQIQSSKPTNIDSSLVSCESNSCNNTEVENDSSIPNKKFTKCHGKSVENKEIAEEKERLATNNIPVTRSKNVVKKLAKRIVTRNSTRITRNSTKNSNKKLIKIAANNSRAEDENPGSSNETNRTLDKSQVKMLCVDGDVSENNVFVAVQSATGSQVFKPIKILSKLEISEPDIVDSTISNNGWQNNILEKLSEIKSLVLNINDQSSLAKIHGVLNYTYKQIMVLCAGKIAQKISKKNSTSTEKLVTDLDVETVSVSTKESSSIFKDINVPHIEMFNQSVNSEEASISKILNGDADNSHLIVNKEQDTTVRSCKRTNSCVTDLMQTDCDDLCVANKKLKIDDSQTVLLPHLPTNDSIENDNQETTDDLKVVEMENADKMGKTAIDEKQDLPKADESENGKESDDKANPENELSLRWSANETPLRTYSKPFKYQWKNDSDMYDSDSSQDDLNDSKSVTSDNGELDIVE